MPLFRVFNGEVTSPGYLDDEEFRDPTEVTGMPVAVPMGWKEEKHHPESWPLSVTIRLYREARLAMGWAADTERFSPLFETRAYVCAHIREGGDLDDQTLEGELYPSVSCEELMYGLPQLVRVRGKWQKLYVQGFDATAIQENLSWKINPLNSEDEGLYGHWYFSWTLVSPDQVNFWFNRRIGQHDQELWSEFTSEGRSKQSSPFVPWYPMGFFGHKIEQAIWDGSLQAAFKNEVEHLVDALQQRESDWLQGARQKTSRVIEDLRSDLSLNSSSDSEG